MDAMVMLGALVGAALGLWLGPPLVDWFEGWRERKRERLWRKQAQTAGMTIVTSEELDREFDAILSAAERR